MQVEVDQSGKVEWTQKPTVLAFANGEKYSIRISVQAKRIVLENLARKKPYLGRKQHRIRVFATLLFLLLKNHLLKINYAVIDVEYQKHEPSIKDWVLTLCRRHKIALDKDQIIFHHVTKKSPAHDLAIKVFQGKIKPDRDITADEVAEEV